MARELTDIEINRLNTVTFEVRVRLTRKFRLRLYIAILLIKLVGKIIPCNFEYTEEKIES